MTFSIFIVSLTCSLVQASHLFQSKRAFSELPWTYAHTVPIHCQDLSLCEKNAPTYFTVPHNPSRDTSSMTITSGTVIKFDVFPGQIRLFHDDRLVCLIHTLLAHPLCLYVYIPAIFRLTLIYHLVRPIDVPIHIQFHTYHLIFLTPGFGQQDLNPL